MSMPVLDRWIGTSKLFLAALVVVCASTVSVWAQQRVLEVRPHRQNTLVWCWAASAAAAIEYETGRPIEDCQVLAAYDRALGGSGPCCVNPAPCLRGGRPGEIESILTSVFGVEQSSQPTPASFEEIEKHIGDGHPLIVWLWRDQFSAHVVVIAGYSLSGPSVLVLDPLQGSLWVPYAVLRANWMTGVWRDTIFVGSASTPEPTIPQQVPAHWCCTPVGKFGPYYPNDVLVGAPCHWPTPGGTVYGTACN